MGLLWESQARIEETIDFFMHEKKHRSSKSEAGGWPCLRLLYPPAHTGCIMPVRLHTHSPGAGTYLANPMFKNRKLWRLASALRHVKRSVPGHVDLLNLIQDPLDLGDLEHHFSCKLKTSLLTWADLYHQLQALLM